MLPGIVKLSFVHLTVNIYSFHCFENANMSTIKLFYMILVSGIAVYFLFYSLVVKIYFDDKTPLVDDNDTREESRYHTTLKGRELRHNRYSQLSQHSVIRGKLSPFIYRARETIFSFLETFGLTVSKKPLNSFEKGTTQSPRVSPKPWRKLQQSLVSSLAPDKPCPTKHLGKGKPTIYSGFISSRNTFQFSLKYQLFVIH